MIKCFEQAISTESLEQYLMQYLIYLKSYFPKLLKVGHIIPIFKSDDAFDPSNYRGITVSSCLGS